MDQRLADLLTLLELEQLEVDLFRGESRDIGSPQVFGGQVLGQALTAASATVEGRIVHSLHAYFLRPGKNDASTTLRVERLRDGRSFSTRTVVACQDDEPIFTVTASFHKDEPGGDFATPIATDVPGPDDLADSQTELSRTLWGEDSPFERLEVPEYSHTRQSPTPRRAMWIRSRAALPDDPGLHACVITFLSDMGVLAAVRAARSGSERPAMAASLDHAVWFHRPARADEWLLFDVAARSSASSRGLGIGTMHTLGGVHAVTVGQEGLVRL